MSRYASVAAVVVTVVAACESKPHDPGAATATATATASAAATDAATAAAADAAAATDAAPAPDASFADLGLLDPAFLAGVTVAKTSSVDATDLGPTVDVRLVQRLTGESGELKPIEILLIVSGTRTVAVDVGHSWDYMEEGLPAGSLILVAEEETPAPWSAETDPDNIRTRLRSRGPVLYRFSMDSPHLLDSFAVVREKDALVVYTFTQDSGYSSDAWEKQATIELPRGATLRFP